MYTLLITLTLIIAVLLILVVLMQSSKGGGLSGTIGGGAGAGGNFGQMFGARRTADFLSRATWWLGGSLIALSILINLFFLPRQLTQEQRESIIQSGRETVPSQSILPPTTTEQGSEDNTGGDEGAGQQLPE